MLEREWNACREVLGKPGLLAVFTNWILYPIVFLDSTTAYLGLVLVLKSAHPTVYTGLYLFSL